MRSETKGKPLKHTDIYGIEEESDTEPIPFNMGVEKRPRRARKPQEYKGRRNSVAAFDQKKTCDEKIRHHTLNEAEQIADLGNDRVALKEKPLHAYHCPKHDCYHIGHMRWIGTTQASRLLKESRARAWARQVQQAQIPAVRI